jgi:ABC-type dipeptide/oligopeptide/nickel transport system ATPase component
MKIKPYQRQKLIFYLKEFYKRYPNEKYTVFHFIKAFRLRIKDNKDAWVGVSGDTGSGKSYTVIMLQILFRAGFSLVDNVTYMPKGNEIIDKFNKLEKNSLLIDESAVEMRSVNWQSKSQQKVNVKAMTDRFKNNLIFLNMPNFNEFTKSMRQGSIMFRLLVLYRTDKYVRVLLQRKSRNFRSEDPWGDKLANKMYQVLEKKKIEITNEKLLEIERKLPNTIMDFILPNPMKIIPEFMNEYERLKLKSREIADKEAPETQASKYKERYKNLMQKTCNLLFYNDLDIGKTRTTKTDICKALDISQMTLNKYLEKR